MLVEDAQRLPNLTLFDAVDLIRGKKPEDAIPDADAGVDMLNQALMGTQKR